jgi:hypothetical protein
LIEQKRFKADKNARASTYVKARAHHASRSSRESSFIRTVTVGSRIELDLLTFGHLATAEALAGLWLSPLTAGGELHPALKTTPL